MQVAKDAEAIVGPFGRHSQLPQGCADLWKEKGRTLTQKWEEEIEQIGLLRVNRKPGGE